MKSANMLEQQVEAGGFAGMILEVNDYCTESLVPSHDGLRIWAQSPVYHTVNGYLGLSLS